MAINIFVCDEHLPPVLISSRIMGRYSIKRYKTKRRTRDLDLVYNDLATPQSIHKLKNQPLDENLPGLGQYYCVHCAKYFEEQLALDRHTVTKVHKRRVRELKARPYTPLEAEAAAGVNLERFLTSVEQYKTDEQIKVNEKAERDAAIGQRRDNLDALITGIPLAEFSNEALAMQE